jgi:hypothetical protein
MLMYEGAFRLKSPRRPAKDQFARFGDDRNAAAVDRTQPHPVVLAG